MKIDVTIKFLLIFLSFISFNYSFSQNKSGLDTKAFVKMYDSLKADDGYVLLMLERTCSLINHKGEVLFNIPGNLASFYSNKDEIVTHNGNSLVVYNKDLDILWKEPGYIEHELTVTNNNNIMFFSGEYDTINTINVYFNNIICIDSLRNKSVKWRLIEQRKYIMDFMLKDTSIFRYKSVGTSNPDSVLFKIAPSLYRVKLIPIQETSAADSVFESGKYRELFHMNSIQELPANLSEIKDSVFNKGNILLSFNNFSDSIRSFIAVVDPVNYKILWHYVQTDGRGIHTPLMLPNGHILVYINSSSDVPYSSVDEIDPISKKVVWSYAEDFPVVEKRDVMGSCQRLSNGNTLISNILGYVYEVTPEKKIVWLWRSELLPNKNPWFLYRAYSYPKKILNWLELEK